MARQVTDAARPTGSEAAKPDLTRKILVALGAVLIAQALFALCIVSAGQLLAPRNMPFGVVGSSRVVAQAQSSAGLDLIPYPSQSAAMTAIDQGQLYGAYVTGSTSDTLIVVGAKSFFARIDLQAAFLSAAHKLARPVTVQNAKPLPSSDSTGAVVGLLLLPLLVGGYLAATLVFKAAGGTAAARWRAAILAGYALVGALLTDLIAGPLIGAYSGSHFWPLLPCFWLVTTAVVLAAAALQALVGRLATALVAVLFIFVGGPGMGGSGTFMLPNYWRNIGVVLPPQSGVSLIRNVLYFGGNNITTPLIVLFVYALAGLAVVCYLGWIRPARAAAAAPTRGDGAEASPAGNPAAGPPPGNPAAARPGRRRGLVPILVALGICAIMECLFAFNYMSSGHAPAGDQHAVRRRRVLPGPDRGRENHLLEGHPVPERAGGQDRDRSGPDLGRADHLGHLRHLDRRPVHQRPGPAGPGGAVRQRGQDRRAEAHRPAVHADPAGPQGPAQPGRCR